MMDLHEKAKAYLATKQLAWSQTTLRSEGARLRTICDLLSPVATPEALYKALKDKRYGAYSIKTYFVRACAFFEFADEPLARAHRKFMADNARLFKHAYKSERLEITRAEALIAIESTEMAIADMIAALALFRSGLRIHELCKVEGDSVIGKGGKERAVYADVRRYQRSEASLRRALKKAKLKPHSLRKLMATELIGKVPPQDVCEIMGWSSIVTAMRYAQPAREASLRETLKRI